MSNQLLDLLSHWYPERDNCDWVLGTIYKTEGPCYRKAGAMMLFNSLGQQFGMLSGGCLESDIQRHARKVMFDNRPVTLCYDGSDEDDLSFRLGIGCGGTVHIMLHPLHGENHYLQLDRVFEALKRRKPGIYKQSLPSESYPPCFVFNQAMEGQVVPEKSTLSVSEHREWLTIPIKPVPHLLIVGGGMDARPVSAMARQMGWRVSVWDSRPANARAEFFLEADALLSCPVEDLFSYAADQKVNAAVMMTHNISLDAAALAQLNRVQLDYMALLGPIHRKHQVLEEAGLQESQLMQPLSGPAGLAIGGELPESIALSILAECHKALYQSKKAVVDQRDIAA